MTRQATPRRAKARLCVSLAPAALALLLGACASNGAYPSLARRDAERISGTAQPAPAEVPSEAPLAPPDTALEARLSRLVDQASAAHSRFATTRPRAEASISRAGAIAGETWSVASIALSELDSARSDAMIALAELDQLYAAERIARFESESADALAIAAARDRVAALVAEEDTVLTRLRARLGG